MICGDKVIKSMPYREFLDNKYTEWYFQIVNRALSEKRKKSEHYYERHHIIPRCMGGTETVLLTAREHMICHILLFKMTTGKIKGKMYAALRMMGAKNNIQQRVTSKTYELIKAKCVRGEEHWCFGKKRPEHSQFMNLALKGKPKNASHTNKIRKRLRERAKTDPIRSLHWIIEKDGKEFTIKNLKKFCRDNDLIYTTFHQGVKRNGFRLVGRGEKN